MRHFYQAVALLTLLLISTNTQAQAYLDLTQSESDFLPADLAFQLDYQQQGDTVQVRWNIAPGYYLYRDKIKVDGVQAVLTSKAPAKPYTDEFFGETWIYREAANVEVRLSEQAVGDESITIEYQGCADDGLCYPPIEKLIFIEPFTPSATDANAALPTSTDTYEISLWSILIFLAVGAGLALTPCVLPMYPIISGVVLGTGDKPPMRRAVALAIAYTQGMALTYTGVGVLVALLGAQFQAYLQHPAVILFIAGLFFVLALSMFGLFNLQLPQSVMTRLHSIKLSGGQVVSVFGIGAISGLVASPCTTAPLSGILLYIAQSGDVVQGAVSLYALAVGMSLPLILFVIGGQKLVPKAGAWMNSVKVIFGVALVGAAVMFIERLVSVTTANSMWFWFTGFAAVVVAYEFRKHVDGFAKKVLISLPVYIIGAGLMAGLSGLNKDPIEFHQLESRGDLASTLEAHPDQLVVFDLYADWCVACKEFERYTFTDSSVKEFFKEHDVQAVKIDMTKMNEDKERLMRDYQVLGLPTILIFRNGEAVSRITGYEGPEEFIQSLSPHVGG